MSDTREEAISIVRTLTEAGHSALFVGGCVRDQVMGVEPHDYDIATSAKPEEVKLLFRRTVPVGEQFGVVLVLLNGNQYEVATFRSESGYSDGRHPDNVCFADAKADVLRRDFTINGLLYDPLTDRLIDHIGGKTDIENHIIRTIGDPRTRFREDRLRLLRAIRFAARFRYAIEKTTLQAIRELASQVNAVSAERIRVELERMLLGPYPDLTVDLMEQTGLLQEILPEVAALKHTPQPENFHPEGDVFIHTKLMLAAMERPSIELAMGVLLHDIGKPPTLTVRDRIRFDNHNTVGAEMAGNICQRLRFSTAETKRIVHLVSGHMRFMSAPQMRPGRLKTFLSTQHFDDHLELHRLDCLASHGDLSVYEFCRSKLKEYTQEELKPPPLLGGRDLIEIGLEPGPIFSSILEAVREAQLEGDINSRDEALSFVRSRFPDAKRSKD